MTINKINNVDNLNSNELIDLQEMFYSNDSTTDNTIKNTKMNHISGFQYYKGSFGDSSAASKQAGFTLIELMIAILLGVLVTAAAVSILVSSAQTTKVQEASSSLQDSLVFSVSQFKHHIRRANFGSLPTDRTGYFLSHDTPQGGIVLTAPSVATPPASAASAVAVTNLAGLKLSNAVIGSDYLTRPDISDSNIDSQKNDQLTIQYKMPLEDRFDCQGREIPKNYYVIERYFVRDDNGSKALACASTNYKYDETKASSYQIDISKYGKVSTTGIVALQNSDFTGQGTVIIPNVDYFKVLFNVTKQSKFATEPEKLKMNFIAPSTTPATGFKDLRITGIQVGMILKSGNSTMGGTKNEDQRFDVLNQTNLELTSDAKSGSRYMRDVFETSILIRNARGTK